MGDLRSDYILREILEDRKTLTGFLDAIFGFMSRHTDFYHIQNTKDDKLGFPKGVKEQILINCMRKYECPIEQPQITRHLAAVAPPMVAEEVEIVTEESNEESNKCQAVDNLNKCALLDNLKDNLFSMTSPKFNESDYKNGSVFEHYCWSQSLKDVELQILLPKEVKLAKHIKVELKPNYITVKTLLPKEEILVSAETWDKYRHNDVIWSISEGKLLISFDKLKECWWDKLFSVESAIDIKALVSERSINDYTPAIQNTIEKLHTQGNQKHDFNSLSLTGCDHVSRLRQAWEAEGSPFKGQPFDPSVIHFN